MGGFEFEILIDEDLAGITSVSQLASLLNNKVLSLVNDFEDQSWRYSKFQNYIWDNIAQTALSHRERAALVDKSQSTLMAAAQNLRLTDGDEVGQGSEIAEVFLYGLMRHRFGALPVVPKIFYKQNAQDYAKGADSVHIVINGDDFTLWFGEAKFFNSIADARLDSVVASVMNSLSTNKLKKENAIITSLSDLDELVIDGTLRQKIKDALSNRASIDGLKPRIHVPILLLHECATTAAAGEITGDYKSKIVEFHRERAESYFSKQLSKSGAVNKYDDIVFHIILFPVPSKKDIVDVFVRFASIYRDKK